MFHPTVISFKIERNFVYFYLFKILLKLKIKLKIIRLELFSTCIISGTNPTNKLQLELKKREIRKVLIL